MGPPDPDRQHWLKDVKNVCVGTDDRIREGGTSLLLQLSPDQVILRLQGIFYLY
jgi:hypothetical protein